MSGGVLHLLGYWAAVGEAAYRQSWLPRPDRLTGSWSDGDREAVLERLRAGPEFRSFLGSSACRLCGAEVGRSEHTDGVWAWPEGLAHYVERHDVRLPEAFVAGAREGTLPGDLVERIGTPAVWVHHGAGATPVGDPGPFSLDGARWVAWAVAASEPAPGPDPMPFEAARTMVAGLAHRMWPARLSEEGGRWWLSVDGYRTPIERCSADALAALLATFRPADPDRLLSPTEANRIAEQAAGDWGGARVVAVRELPSGGQLWAVSVRRPGGRFPDPQEAIGALRGASPGRVTYHGDGHQTFFAPQADEAGWSTLLLRLRSGVWTFGGA